MSEKSTDKKATYNPEVDQEDLEALHKKGHSMNPGADSQLRRRKDSVDFTGKNLDIPGRKPEKTPQGKNPADEENKHYSQGGPGKENLEERKDS